MSATTSNIACSRVCSALICIVSVFHFSGAIAQTYPASSPLMSKYGQGTATYYGAPATLTGEKGVTVPGCSVRSGNTCQRSHSMWGAGFAVPGGLLQVSPPSTGYNITGGTNCYFYGVWGIQGSFDVNIGGWMSSAVGITMSRTVSAGVWNPTSQVYVNDNPVIVAQPCAAITPSWMQTYGNIFVPLDSGSLYGNIVNPGSNYGVYSMDFSQSLTTFISNDDLITFSYKILACPSSALTSDCVGSSYGQILIGEPGTIVPVPPVECTVSGDGLIDLGVISVSDGIGKSNRTTLNLMCSSSTTVTAKIIDSVLTKGGITTEITFTGGATTSVISMNQGSAAPIDVVAKIKNLDASTTAGVYEMHSVLLVSYN